jgi:hypothetical protein
MLLSCARFPAIFALRSSDTGFGRGKEVLRARAGGGQNVSFPPRHERGEVGRLGVVRDPSRRPS